MTQADRVLSTPPTNAPVDDPTRRRFLTVAAVGSMVGVGTIAVAAATPTVDAELVELGARFEPLVDKYYIARMRWARSMVAAHAEHDQKFGSREERGYNDTPEITAAFEASCARTGLKEAADTLSAIYEDMEPLADAINAASVTSIDGLRVKALVAFWQVAPLCAGDTEFSFDDAHPFQQLLTAVAELCGLKDKMAATGYELPDIGMDDGSDDDEEGVEA